MTTMNQSECFISTNLFMTLVPGVIDFQTNNSVTTGVWIGLTRSGADYFYQVSVSYDCTNPLN